MEATSLVLPPGSVSPHGSDAWRNVSCGGASRRVTLSPLRTLSLPL